MNESYRIMHDDIRHYQNLLSARRRNEWYLQRLMQSAAGKVVLDMGTGTGLLSHYALRAGASFVYAIESSSTMAKVAQAILAQTYDRSRFKVCNLDFWTANVASFLSHDIDLFVSETLGPELFDQGMLYTWRVLGDLPQKRLQSIPDALSIDLWLVHDHGSINYVEQDKIEKCDLLDDAFFHAIRNIDSILSQANRSDISKRYAMLQDIQPDDVIVDFISYSYDQQPHFEPSGAVTESPFTVKPIISKRLHLPVACTLMIMPKLVHENSTLYFAHSDLQDWMYHPCFLVRSPGEYVLSYNCATPYDQYSYGLNAINGWILEAVHD